MIKDYYSLTKPGIIYGNAITLIAGFVLASHGKVDYLLLFLVFVGLSLVIASGCVFNNYIDRDIDRLMERTKKRAMVRGSISPLAARIYGTVLGLLGFGVLLLYTNIITVTVSLVGFFVYVVVYSMWLKRSSTHSAIVGSISGAVPPVVGYIAVTGHFDLGALLLFSILALWQMPHSFAIAMYRLSDYTSANIPVLPVKKGIQRTKVQILIYTILFFIAIELLFAFGYVGILYFFVMTTLGLMWIRLCLFGLYGTSVVDKDWARKIFLFSLVILVVFCVMLVLEATFS